MIELKTIVNPDRVIQMWFEGKKPQSIDAAKENEIQMCCQEEYDTALRIAKTDKIYSDKYVYFSSIGQGMSPTLSKENFKRAGIKLIIGKLFSLIPNRLLRTFICQKVAVIYKKNMDKKIEILENQFKAKYTKLRAILFLKYQNQFDIEKVKPVPVDLLNCYPPGFENNFLNV